MEEFIRTEMLIGDDALGQLADARVAVFGVGGVGSYVVEALARAGVGALDLIDKDTVSLSNINRQLIALHSTVGKSKVSVARERVLDINPSCTVTTYEDFFLPETSDKWRFEDYTYVVDAIDTVTGKLELISAAKRAGVPIISSMGTGNKLDPSKFAIADISQTSICPLARVMRKECKKRGLENFKVLYSTEEALKPGFKPEDSDNPGRKDTPGSISFVPSVAGLMIAGEVIKDIIA